MPRINAESKLASTREPNETDMRHYAGLLSTKRDLIRHTIFTHCSFVHGHVCVSQHSRFIRVPVRVAYSCSGIGNGPRECLVHSFSLSRRMGNMPTAPWLWLPFAHPFCRDRSLSCVTITRGSSNGHCLSASDSFIKINSADFQRSIASKE